MTNLFDRRSVLALGSGLTAAAALPAYAQKTVGDNSSHEAHQQMMNSVPDDAPVVSMMVYPKMVALDLIGPMTVFSIMRYKIELVWKDKMPVSTDVGMPFSATHTFDEAATNPNVLFVPGGIIGTIDCMNDTQVIDYLADRGEQADWVTSVCTGSLVLGAAGLLQGRDATSHWGVVNLLPIFGAHHVDQRVVQDGNRITGGGVTAGIDFGLQLAAKMADEETARRVQLIMEYAPEPPFKNGTPTQAGPERMAAMLDRRATMDSMAMEAAQAAGKRLGTL